MTFTHSNNSRRQVLVGLAAGLGGFAPTMPQPLASPTRLALDDLPPIRGPIAANNWRNPWAPATWPKAGGVHSWRAENVELRRGELHLWLNSRGGASVQANGSERRENALFEVEATLPAPRDGMIAAPLYLYGDEGHEVDFEMVGQKGLQLSIHTARKFNAYTVAIPGDWSGRRRFGISYQAGRSVGWLVDVVEIHRHDKGADAEAFPYHGLKPYAEVWATRNIPWAGRWLPSEAEMVLHGYRTTAIAPNTSTGET